MLRCLNDSLCILGGRLYIVFCGRICQIFETGKNQILFEKAKKKAKKKTCKYIISYVFMIYNVSSYVKFIRQKETQACIVTFELRKSLLAFSVYSKVPANTVNKF